MDLNVLNIEQAHQGLKEKSFSSLELTKACLKQVEKVDKKIHSFITLTPELALEQAKRVDEKIKRGEEIDKLAGIPFAVKDNILVKDVITTAGSKMLQKYFPPYDAYVIQKLKEKGAVILGKTNLDEFAMGSSTENSAMGPTKNPLDLERVPGGTSGGSAAAVAAKMCLFSLGSDTGGSIREPASFCGVVGLKPTYGKVSRYGLISMASSLDQIGPLTKTVKDAADVLRAIEGKDPLDSTNVSSSATISELLSKNIKGLKIGVPKEYFVEGMDKEVEKKVKEAIKKLEELGAKIEEVSLPYTQYALSIYYIIMPAEVSSNLARYDGIRYGFSEKEAENLLDVYLKSKGKGFGDEVKRRIILGTYVLSAGYYDAYYLKAQKVRRLIIKDFEKVFTQVDCLVTPTSPTIAFKLGEKFDDPLTMYLSDIYTVSANLAGIPGISVPCGLANNLPVGLQFLGKWFDESVIFQAAYSFEQANL